MPNQISHTLYYFLFMKCPDIFKEMKVEGLLLMARRKWGVLMGAGSHHSKKTVTKTV